VAAQESPHVSASDAVDGADDPDHDAVGRGRRAATPLRARLRRNVGKDQSRWSPGVNEGKPIEFSDNCYLIRHDKGLLLWDTGVPDAVAGMADGMVVANGAITWPATTTCSATGA
jgi:hypothetical protein